MTNMAERNSHIALKLMASIMVATSALFGVQFQNLKLEQKVDVQAIENAGSTITNTPNQTMVKD